MPAGHVRVTLQSSCSEEHAALDATNTPTAQAPPHQRAAPVSVVNITRPSLSSLHFELGRRDAHRTIGRLDGLDFTAQAGITAVARN